MSERGRFALAAAAVAALALLFRLLRLTTVPAGLFVDEVLTARNALAWRLGAEPDWLGARPLLVAGWVETSHLYLAFASTVMRIFGDDLAGVRMISTLPALACVPLLYWLGREVAERRAALLAALLLGVGHWAARTGRTGWDQVLMTALQLAALALLARGVRLGRARPGAAAGGALGLALHTYVAARVVAAQALLWQAWECLAAWRADDGTAGEDPAGDRGRGRRRAALGRLALLAATLVLVAAPFHARLLRERPEQLGLRARQLSALAVEGPGEPWATLAESAVAHLAMFHVRGGAYARDALPGFPMLDPVSGLLLLAGLVVLARRGGWRRRLLLSWPAVGLLAGVLSVSGEGPPYPYRVGHLAPWACLVAGLGGIALWDAVRERLGVRAAVAVAAVALAAVVAVNGWVLFVAGPRHPAHVRVYGVAATTIGRWLAAHRDGRPALVHRGALAPPAPARRDRHAAANASDHMRPVDRAATVQLAAGLWAATPRRALDPIAARGDVDVVARLPAGPPPGAVLVVPLGEAERAAARRAASRRHLLRLPDGTPFAVALEPVAPHRE